MDATEVEPEDEQKMNILERLEAESSNYVKPGFVRSLKAGDSVGEEIFSEDRVEMPFFMQCVKRCLTLSLSKKDFAEVLYF